MRTVSAVAILMCWGCGGGSPTLSLHTNLETALECTNRANLAREMKATLDISGHAQCENLEVADNLQVHGNCDVTIGSVRYLGLAYERQGSMLAYVIGWVDLRKEALREDAATVSVELDGRDESAQVDTNTERDELLVDCPSLETASEICQAKGWAKNLLDGAATTFDDDGDGESNLVRACTSSQ